MRKLIPLSLFLAFASMAAAQTTTTTIYSTTDFSGWVLGTKPTISSGDLVTTASTTNAALVYFETPGNQYQFTTGTTLTLSTDFTVTGTPVSSSRTFYLTLQNSNSTASTNNQVAALTTANTNTLFSSYTGYGLIVNPSPANASAGQFDARTGTNTAIIGSTAPWTLPGSVTAMSSQTFTLNNTDTYNFSYSIYNASSTEMDFTYTMKDVTTDTVLYTVSMLGTGLSGSSYITAFDTIALGDTSAQTASYRYLDVSLTATSPLAVPEPATYALGLGVLAIGFAAWRRHRLQQA